MDGATGYNLSVPGYHHWQPIQPNPGPTTHSYLHPSPYSLVEYSACYNCLHHSSLSPAPHEIPAPPLTSARYLVSARSFFILTSFA